METNLQKVKDTAIKFLYFDVEANEEFPFIVSHPYFETSVIMTRGGKMIDIVKDKKELEEIRRDMTAQIKKSNLSRIFLMMRTNYHLSFLKFVKPYLSREDFAKRLGSAWICSENPNQDVNVPVPLLIKWFKTTDQKMLMEKDEFDYYSKLPDIVEIYRGVSVGRAEKDGLSWTCNRKTAEWFAHRFDNDDEEGYILKAKINKKDIFAYFNSRSEDEILCNSSKIFELERL